MPASSSWDSGPRPSGSGLTASASRSAFLASRSAAVCSGGMGRLEHAEKRAGRGYGEVRCLLAAAQPKSQ